MGRVAAKVDGNHAAIVRGLRDMGAGVLSTATLGRGAPDILAYYLRTYVLLEIKLPGENLNAAQLDFHAAWPGPIYVVRSVAEAKLAVAEAARPCACRGGGPQ